MVDLNVLLGLLSSHQTCLGFNKHQVIAICVSDCHRQRGLVRRQTHFVYHLICQWAQIALIIVQIQTIQQI